MAPWATGTAHAQAGFPGLLSTWHPLLPAVLCPPALSLPRAPAGPSRSWLPTLLGLLESAVPRQPCSLHRSGSLVPGPRSCPRRADSALAFGPCSGCHLLRRCWSPQVHQALQAHRCFPSGPGTELAREGALGAAFPEASPPGVLTWPGPQGLSPNNLCPPAQLALAPGVPAPPSGPGRTPGWHSCPGEARAGGHGPKGHLGGLASTCLAPWPGAGGCLGPLPS